MESILQVPTIDIRERISASVIDEITRRIVNRFDPLKIVLFGSYAYGVPKPESDVDILVVMKTSQSEIQQAQTIRRYINPLFGLDLIVYTPENLEKRLQLGDPFLKEIMKKGAILYEPSDD